MLMPEASGCTFMAGNSRFQETGVIYFRHLWCTTKCYLTATFCVSRSKVYLSASGSYPEPVTWQWFNRSNQTFYSALFCWSPLPKSLALAMPRTKTMGSCRRCGSSYLLWSEPNSPHGKSVCLSRSLWRQLVSDVTLVLPTEKYRYPRQVYVARDPGCCEVVSGASCPSRGKFSSGPSIHQKPAIWRLWVDISLLHLGTRQLLFPLGCCVGLGLWWQCVVNFEAEGQSYLKPLLKSKAGLARLCASIYLNEIQEQGARPTSQGNAAVNRIDTCLSQSDATILRASGSLCSILQLQCWRRTTTICSVQHCSKRDFRPWPCQVQLHVKAIDMYSF